MRLSGRTGKPLNDGFHSLITVFSGVASFWPEGRINSEAGASCATKEREEEVNRVFGVAPSEPTQHNGDQALNKGEDCVQSLHVDA